MAQIHVRELSRMALDYCVAQLEKRHGSYLTFFASQWHLNKSLRYSSEWVMGGPIIDREKINTEYRKQTFGDGVPHWYAIHPKNYGGLIRCSGSGGTLLVAAMRCYVSSRLGDVVTVPDSLV